MYEHRDVQDVECEHLLDIRLGVVLDPRPADESARVVDEHVDAAELAERLGDDLLDRPALRDVAADEGRLAAQRLAVRRHGFRRLAAGVVMDDQATAKTRERARGGRAYPGRRAGDENRLALEIRNHDLLPNVGDAHRLSQREPEGTGLP